MKERTSGGVVSIIDVTDGFLGCAGVVDVSWVKSKMFISSISSLALTSNISFITFVMVEGSRKSENRGRGCDLLTFSRGFSG